MKLSKRKVAFILCAAVLVGFAPDSFNLQSPRNEEITILARNVLEAPTVLPLALAPQNTPIADTSLAPIPAAVNTPIVPAPPSIEDKSDLVHQRATSPAAVAAPPVVSYEALNLYIHLPPDAAKHQPLRVLIVLHGMGARGDVFSQNLIGEADKNYWLVVAPTLEYGNYMEPATLNTEDLKFSAMLDDMMQNLPKKLGIRLRSHALVFGFSRGAQLGHRFALFYPSRVEAIASISAGSYTLPTERASNDASAPIIQMPYGVGDLEKYLGHSLNYPQLSQVAFLLEVGANDIQPSDVPRQFDAYEGNSRVARATAFQRILTTFGVQARLEIFQDASHEVTPDMRIIALQFLRNQEQLKKLND
jgi:pimeloyl-ACP methyl ester carboxylesterase